MKSFFQVRPLCWSNNFYKSPDDRFLAENRVKIEHLRLIKHFFELIRKKRFIVLLLGVCVMLQVHPLRNVVNPLRDIKSRKVPTPPIILACKRSISKIFPVCVKKFSRDYSQGPKIGTFFCHHFFDKSPNFWVHFFLSSYLTRISRMRVSVDSTTVKTFLDLYKTDGDTLKKTQVQSPIENNYPIQIS